MRRRVGYFHLSILVRTSMSAPASGTAGAPSLNVALLRRAASLARIWVGFIHVLRQRGVGFLNRQPRRNLALRAGNALGDLSG